MNKKQKRGRQAKSLRLVRGGGGKYGAVSQNCSRMKCLSKVAHDWIRDREGGNGPY